jgi:hypothetical protein
VRVQFDATLDDVVDASLRALSRSKAARSWRWADYTAGVLLTGLGAGLVLYVLVSGELRERLILSGIGAVVAASLYPIFYIWTVKRRLRSYYREQLGSRGPFAVEVEVSASGVSARQEGTTTTFEWAIVDCIEETADSIDFHIKKGGIVVVRERAFGSPELMRQFTATANGLLDQARSAGGTRPGCAGKTPAADNRGR